MSDSRGVTPVVGIVLFVAVTLILAAPVLVFGMEFAGQTSDPAPTTRFETVDARVGLGVEHTGGDSVDAENLYFQFGDESVPATNLTSRDSIAVGTTLTFQPRGADEIDLVWRSDGDSQVIKTIRSYSSTAVFEFTGEEAKTLDVSNTDNVTVSVAGAGGESAGYSSGASGGLVTATLDVTDVDKLTIYVGESPSSTPSNPVGGWGWKSGGAPNAGAGFVGGGGGGATAIIADGTPVLVADGGGGGADWDTYTFYAGGGGARGGDGGPLWWGDSAGSGGGSGLGGDGAGGTVGGDESSFVAATAGGAEVLDSRTVSNAEVETGGGSGAGGDGRVTITYTV